MSYDLLQNSILQQRIIDTYHFHHQKVFQRHRDNVKRIYQTEYQKSQYYTDINDNKITIAQKQPLFDYFVNPQTQVVDKDTKFNKKYYYQQIDQHVPITISYLNINGNANTKLQPNKPLHHIIQTQLNQPDILAFVEVKKDSKLNTKFTKLDGYGTYLIPPRVTENEGLSNGIRINFKLLSSNAWLITHSMQYFLTIEHRWYHIVIIIVYLVPENDENSSIVSNIF